MDYLRRTAMTNAEFQQYCMGAINCGGFLTPKHDPSGLSNPYSTFRTVVLQNAQQLYSMFASDGIEVMECVNTINNNSPSYFVVTSKVAGFVAGSGVPAYATVPTTACDRLVVVSGVVQGLHIFAEQSSAIAAKIADGSLKVVGPLSGQPIKFNLPSGLSGATNP
jgi:hypothetical protein